MCFLKVPKEPSPNLITTQCAAKATVQWCLCSLLQPLACPLISLSCSSLWWVGAYIWILLAHLGRVIHIKQPSPISSPTFSMFYHQVKGCSQRKLPGRQRRLKAIVWQQDDNVVGGGNFKRMGTVFGPLTSPSVDLTWYANWAGSHLLIGHCNPIFKVIECLKTPSQYPPHCIHVSNGRVDVGLPGE